MAVATKQRPERSTRVTITNDNSKHAIHSTVEVTDPDADAAWRTAALLMERSLEQFGDPARAEAVGEYQAEVRRLKDAKKETK